MQQFDAAVYKLKRRLLEQGGGTVHAVRYSEPDDGYVVAYQKSTECKLDACFALACLPALLAHFCRHHADTLKHPDCYVGVWYEGGFVYLDVVRRYSTAEEALAVAAGASQLAVWDATKGECVYVH